jgi:hypothetical protein
MLQEREIEQIRALYAQGYDLEFISKRVLTANAIEIAQYIDLAFWDITQRWESVATATEIYRADTFLKLVDMVPGLLSKTRRVIKSQFNKLYGCKLFQEFISTRHGAGNVSFPASRPISKESFNRGVHYVY